MGYDKIPRPLLAVGATKTKEYQRSNYTSSTAGSTALAARGVIELGTSSTSAAANWILTAPAGLGEEVTFVVKTHGSTYGVTINASTADTITFGTDAATTDMHRLVLTGALGSAASIVSISTAQWLVTSSVNASFTTGAA